MLSSPTGRKTSGQPVLAAAGAIDRDFGLYLVGFGQGIDPRVLEMAAGITWADSQVLVTIQSRVESLVDSRV